MSEAPAPQDSDIPAPEPPRIPPRILTIAGSDSSGGAGIQADIKTITMLGGYAMSAITAITAQNSVGVQQIEILSADLVTAQIESCLSDIGADAIKIGMLGSADIANAVADILETRDIPIVFDPVMIATSGATLADAATIKAFERLMQLATVTTPNLPELAALLGDKHDLSGPLLGGDVTTIEATLALSERFNCAVLSKGGHGAGTRITDLLIDPENRIASFDDERIDTKHSHGTGCTLSSAIATLLGHGQSLEHSIRLSRQFVRKALEAAPGFGAGHGPMGHQAVRN